MTRLLPQLALLAAIVSLMACEAAGDDAHPLNALALDSSFVAGQDHLFLSYWAGMSPQEFREVTTHHTADTTVTLVTSKLTDYDEWFANAEFDGKPVHVVPDFVPDPDGQPRLRSVRVEGWGSGRLTLIEVFDLYQTKYGEPENSAAIGPPPPSCYETELDAFFGDVKPDCDPVPEGHEGTARTELASWRDGDRMISLTFEGQRRRNGGGYDNINWIEVEYASQAFLGAEEARERSAQDRLDSEQRAVEEEWEVTRTRQRRDALESI